MDIKPGLGQTEKISIITLSGNNNFLAYAFKSSPAIIIVVDLSNKKKKPKILTTSDIKSDEYIAL